ncbi:MAG TPA: isoprenylcysteine carboxylmethyltransferase family protein [Pyrinomonadaceae bacterium]|nr:isoprenylcysteine carboxylmethyltransferase family protein [Pyrinomonadaceae bacterium]
MTFFDRFQVASVVGFLVIVLSRAIYLRLSKDINAIVIGGGKKGIVLFVELISFAGLVVWIIEVLLYALHSGSHIFPAPLDTQLFASQLTKIIGVAVITVGFGIFILAFISFGDSWRVGFDMRTPGALVTSGIFAVTRNPIYLFINLWFLGIFLINGRLIFLIFTLLTVVAIHWQILQEEAFLRRLYGQAYHDYCARTGRYWSFR